jgi:hypothetical protein
MAYELMTTTALLTNPHLACASSPSVFWPRNHTDMKTLECMHKVNLQNIDIGACGIKKYWLVQYLQ